MGDSNTSLAKGILFLEGVEVDGHLKGSIIDGKKHCREIIKHY